MSLYVIADLHLSFGTDKPMDIFGGWEDYAQKIKQNWTKRVDPGDTVVIPGDISWGMNLEEARPDFEFLDKLPGKKYFSKEIMTIILAQRTKSTNFLAKTVLKVWTFCQIIPMNMENIRFAEQEAGLMSPDKPQTAKF